MKFARKNCNAESLIEVIIALGILLLVIGPAGALYTSSMRNTTVNRDKLVAEALADSGIEIVRNMRDTNLLRFSPKASLCWNAKPELPTVSALEDGLDSCELPENKISAGSYRLIMDSGFNWTLDGIQDTALASDFNPPADSPYRLKLDSSNNFYNHASGSYTNFYREIFISYSPGGKSLKAASTVFFRAGSNVYRVRRATFLTPEAR